MTPIDALSARIRDLEDQVIALDRSLCAALGELEALCRCVLDYRAVAPEPQTCDQQICHLNESKALENAIETLCEHEATTNLRLVSSALVKRHFTERLRKQEAPL